MHTDALDLLLRLTMALDAADEALTAAATAEQRREAGKPLRQITAQERAKHARELVNEAEAFLAAQQGEAAE